MKTTPSQDEMDHINTGKSAKKGMRRSKNVSYPGPKKMTQVRRALTTSKKS